jgi:hypothetical protein
MRFAYGRSPGNTTCIPFVRISRLPEVLPRTTPLLEILALGENSLAATELPDNPLSSTPTAWTPSSGFMTPLSQTVGGMETRTESLEHGELGMPQSLAAATAWCAKLGVSISPPAGPNESRDVDDTFNDIGSARTATDAFQITDATNTEFAATTGDGDDTNLSTAAEPKRASAVATDDARPVPVFG